jgi:hypothetical protein
MNQNVIYIGLDVDDNQYHGPALNTETGEVITFKCRPSTRRINLTPQHHKREIRANIRPLAPSHSDNGLANTLKSDTGSLKLPFFTWFQLSGFHQAISHQATYPCVAVPCREV